MSAIEIAAAAFGLVCVWLTMRENVWCWPTGLVQVVLYIYVFYEARLYADTGLQVIYVFLQLYGWHQWLHGGARHGTLHISRAARPLLLQLLLLGGLSTAALGYAFHRWTDASVPYWDSVIVAFSLVAQWMLARKLLQNWLFWIAVDVVAIGVYLYKGLLPTGVLYAVFLVLAILGYRQWARTLHKAETSQT
jgi:nicotinamide mononucleotide transporter